VSSLVEVDAEGAPREKTNLPVNPAGFVIHSTIHAARVRVCIPHTASERSETRRRLSSDKTGRLVQLEITEQTRNPLQDSLR
jgi:hypothetical protein